MGQRTYYTSPSQKNFYVYDDFSRGMNSSSAPTQMMDSELALALNVDLDDRGAIRRRTGMVSHSLPLQTEGEAQGFFRHYTSQYTYKEILAKNGRLEIDNVDTGISFQTTRPIEAVQWYDKTYIATGSGLYIYDGTTVEAAVPYRPQPLEALYIGTNALAENPDDYLSNGTGSTTQLMGVTFDKRYGVMNEPFTMTAYYSKKVEDTLEFQFEYRYPWQEEGVYILGQDWSTDNTWTHTPVGDGDMQFRINARAVGLVVAEAQYLIPTYKVKPAPDTNDIAPAGGIQTCNRIVLHWERLIMYGDTVNTSTVYMSHLKTPTYFPTPNNLNFETKRREALTSLVRFRDFIVAFTDTSIQALYGKSPQDYRRAVLNTDVGCIAPRGITVMDNYIVFLSNSGIYYLKSVGYQEDKANVDKLDTAIGNQVPRSRKAALTVYNNQLHAIFPDENVRFRYYKPLGSWVKDESPYLDMNELLLFDTDLYGVRVGGQVMKFRSDVYTDNNYVYEAAIELPYQDFGMPFHTKKMKEVQITAEADLTEEGVKADLTLTLDGKHGAPQVVTYEAAFVRDDEGFLAFVDKIRATGKCYRVATRISHTTGNFFQLISVAFVNKAKKP